MSLDPTRSQRITASMVPILMWGDPMAIQNLFLRAIDDPRYEPDDFSNTWIAHYGLAIEPIALDWHEKKTGHQLTDRGTQYFHPAREYVSCTLDARRPHDNTVIDVKCINSHRPLNDALAYYTPQMIVQMECAKADAASLLIVHGGTEPQEVPVYIEAQYRELVWQTIDRFWQCVETLTPPHPLEFRRIVPPDKWRQIDLDHDANLPNWADEMKNLLATWGATEGAAKANEATKVNIKKILPDDCGKLFYAQFCIARARNNAVSVKRREL